MANILFRTKSGNVDPKGKRKVYFTCHPDDFARYFDTVCKDIFRSHDCVIYYTEDMSEEIANEDKPSVLGHMNLFIVPITFRLLSEPNRAMDDDIAYAKSNHIPILPLMMESGIDEFYGKPDKFGELQYLSPYTNDRTEIAYENKLKKYLNSVLISDDMAQKIRKAFDAYIFLSYRKKDRRYANELMKLIHGIPEYRDIAIWYDELLNPGESFRENIKKALRESKLFALLVTPNVLEKPNFVMTEEYPTAKDTSMVILPTEMVATDRTRLKDEYDGIPECADPREAEAFKERFLNALSKIAITKNDGDSMHNFLIGLAYLDGIDVEVDREKGLALIAGAAEEGLVEAMQKLYDMYEDGIGVYVDYAKAAEWGKRVADHYRAHEGEKSEKTLTALNRLSATYVYAGDFKNALTFAKQVYDCELQTRGEAHKFTVDALNNVAYIYGKMGEPRKALEMHEKAYTLQKKLFGEAHRETLVSLNNLAMAYTELITPDYEQALALNRKAYELRHKLFGALDSDTILSLNNVAYVYTKLEKYDEALKLYEQAYTSCCDAFGEKSANTLNVLRNLSMAYGGCGNIAREIETQRKVCELCAQIFGGQSPRLLSDVFELAMIYEAYDLYDEAVSTFEKAYSLSCKIKGEDDSKELLLKIALTYRKAGKEEKCKETIEKFKKSSGWF